MIRYWCLLVCMLVLQTTFTLSCFSQKRLHCENGEIKFISDAPLELIQASTQSLKGIIDMDRKTFAYVIEVNSFKGFNSVLQQQHFYENYLHTAKFPRATFTGKIIDHIDFEKTGTYQVRAKGLLEIHGSVKERIIPCEVKVENEVIWVSGEFYVPLEDHNINVPKIVNQKIAEEILVEIRAKFLP